MRVPYLLTLVIQLSGCLYWPTLDKEKAPPFAPEDCAGTIISTTLVLYNQGSCSHGLIADDATFGTGYILTIKAPPSEAFGASTSMKLEVDGAPQCVMSGEISEHWEYSPVASDYATYLQDSVCASSCPTQEPELVSLDVTFCDSANDSVYSDAVALPPLPPTEGPRWRIESPIPAMPGELVIEEWAKDGETRCFALGWFSALDTEGRFAFVSTSGPLSDLTIQGTVGLGGLGVGSKVSILNDRTIGSVALVGAPSWLEPWAAGEAFPQELRVQDLTGGPRWPENFGALAQAACHRL